GGSTITQQLARNLYPDEIGRAPTPEPGTAGPRVRTGPPRDTGSSRGGFRRRTGPGFRVSV
ncbi:hypothetical protein, partial [Actinomadura sp. NPDC000929]|uniref:hypothetical protein n=1 Tax=Actinomadura sp. NPDC000929 TaxID=3154517 RepID=UPI00339368C8